MTIPKDVAALSIIHAETIANAYETTDHINDLFHNYIIEHIRDQIKEIHNDWHISEDIFCPEDWPRESPQTYSAYYKLAWFGEDSWWFSHAAGIEGRGLGLALFMDNAMNKKCTTKNLHNFYTQNSQLLAGARLISCFGTKKEYLVFPFKNVSLDDIAASYLHWDDSMGGTIDDAIRQLNEAHSVIDKFIRHCQK